MRVAQDPRMVQNMEGYIEGLYLDSRVTTNSHRQITVESVVQSAGRSIYPNNFRICVAGNRNCNNKFVKTALAHN